MIEPTWQSNDGDVALYLVTGDHLIPLYGMLLPDPPYRLVGVERDPEFCEIARQRIEAARAQLRLGMEMGEASHCG